MKKEISQTIYMCDMPGCNNTAAETCSACGNDLCREHCREIVSRKVYHTLEFKLGGNSSLVDNFIETAGNYFTNTTSECRLGVYCAPPCEKLTEVFNLLGIGINPKLYEDEVILDGSEEGTKEETSKEGKEETSKEDA